MSAGEHQGNDALQASEQRLSLAQKALGFGVWDWDLLTQRITWSPEMYEILGVDPVSDAADLYAAWLRVLHPDERERQDQITRESASQGRGFSRTFRVVRPGSGEVRWVRTDATVVCDTHGRPLRMVGINLDVTEQQRVTEALRDSQAELKLITDSLPELISFIDRHGIYRFANKAFETWYGQSPADIVGRDVRSVLGEAAFALRQPFIQRALAGEECSLDVEIIRSDGRVRFGEARYLPHRDETGAIDGFHAYVIDITERKHAEAEVRASEARFRGVFESGAGGFSIFDANTGETLALNDRLLAMTGYTRADFDAGAWDWRQFTPPEHLHLDAAAVAQARENGFWAPYEKEFVHKDGHRVPVRLSSAPLPGEPGRVVTVIDDLTEAKAAEAKLRENEERLRLATENAEVGFWDVDVINDVLHWSPRVKGMFGISPDVPVSMQDFYAGLHPDDKEATAVAYRAATDPQKRALYDVEYRTVGKEDGIVRWVAAKGRGIFDAQGRCLRVAGTAIDVTPRKIAEERLRELNETLERRVEAALAERKLLADIVEGTDALVQVADLEFRWLAVNKAAIREFMRLFGVIPRVGASMLDALAHKPAYQAAIRALWSRALAGEQFTQVGEFGDPPLERRFYDMKFSPLRDAQGRIIGAYQFVNDVTQPMLEQEKLRKAEDALRQAQKMEAVGQLTGGIAHDFNNLLQGVAGSLDLIRRRPGERDRVQRWAEGGYRAAERGAKLTAQLLAFSRSQKLEVRPLELSDLVTGFQDMLNRTIGAMIRVKLDLDTDGMLVLGDEVQIEMAVLNLALNARDAMPEGGDLFIRTRPVRMAGDPELADGDYVELAVIDTGTGMPADVIARAFDPFFTTKGVGKGTGLGLSQVYGAMRQAGGTVRIESRVGEGTTVRLFLPRTEGSGLQPRAGADDLGRRTLAARVLIIDDDPDVRRFLAESLDALGFGVIEAQDGQAGLAQVAAARPDVVILDFAMPEMNGAEVARHIRELQPTLPIIFASGFAESAAIEGAADPGSAVLRKPFGLDELQAVLAQALGRGQRATG